MRAFEIFDAIARAAVGGACIAVIAFLAFAAVALALGFGRKRGP